MKVLNNVTVSSIFQNLKDKYYRKPFMPNLRKLLFPFSVLYDGVTRLRNSLYSKDLLESRSFEVPVICVGNLSVGGTGKSPMVEYLLRLLQNDYKIATLSRGYKRQSKAYHLVEIEDSALISGDEPLQFKNNFPKVRVAVDANRREGIKNLLIYSPDVVILDDAFQHRKVKADFYILLTSFGNLYIDDLLLPAGNLRESAAGAKRADLIVVTKCPADISETKMEEITRKLKPQKYQKVFFTSIEYSENIVSSSKKFPLETLNSEEFTLVTGIANPQPLVDFLHSRNLKFEHIKFPDHHIFSDKEIASLKKQNCVLTTQKDYMRLKEKISSEKLFFIPIEVAFIKEQATFDEKVKSFINKK